MAERLFEEEESKAYDMPEIPTHTIFVFLSGFENTAIPGFESCLESRRYHAAILILFWKNRAQKWGDESALRRSD